MFVKRVVDNEPPLTPSMTEVINWAQEDVQEEAAAEIREEDSHTEYNDESV